MKRGADVEPGTGALSCMVEETASLALDVPPGEVERAARLVSGRVAACIDARFLANLARALLKRSKGRTS